MTLDHDYFMALALEQAKEAYKLGEVPVGAILVDLNGQVIASGFNRTIIDHDPTAHAEIVAMRQAGGVLNNYRLIDLNLYVTLEPCCMCAMACIHARIKTLIYGASDLKTGACGSVFNLATDPKHNHKLEIIANIKANECSTLLSDFFSMRRQQHKERKELLRKAKAQF